MITCETYMRFNSRHTVEIRFFRDGKRIGRVYCKDFNCVSSRLAHYERVFGSPIKFPDM